MNYFLYKLHFIWNKIQDGLVTITFSVFPDRLANLR